MRAKKRRFRAWRPLFGLALVGVILLAGCMYPNELRRENRATVKEAVMIVQHAIDEFKNRTGLLPIRNSDMHTPIYEKYVIDMKKLKDGGYIGEIPGLAYENGGPFKFVLVNPEQMPEVKLLDLRVFQQTVDLQQAVDAFKKANNGRLPKGDPVWPGYYRIDFDKLGKKDEQAASVFSPMYLSFLLHESGNVFVDYAPEIMKLMNETGMTGADPNTDLRTLLVQNTPFVPVKSVPYYWRNNQPEPGEPGDGV